MSASKSKPSKTPVKQTKDAATGMCIHRVALTSYCPRCGA